MPRKLIQIIGAIALVSLVAAGIAYAAPRLAGDAHAAPAQEDPPQPRKAWLGVAVAPLTDAIAARLGIPAGPGLAVLKVMPEGPASAAGVQPKDVIRAIDGTEVSTPDALQAQVQTHSPGDTVQLSIQRQDQSLTLTATLGAPPQRAKAGAAHERSGKRGGGMPFAGIPGLHDLKEIPAGERFDHMVERQFTYLDKNNTRVTITVTFGKVVSASETSLTITPNGSQSGSTYQITADTRSRGPVQDLQPGANVVVVTRNGSSQAVAVLAPAAPAQDGERQGVRGSGDGRKFQGPARAIAGQMWQRMQEHGMDMSGLFPGMMGGAGQAHGRQ